MERAAFLLEQTGERIGCLLNPNTIVVRRLTGIRPRRSETGPLTGKGLSDDPLIATGGGRTELDLDLLFDVTLPGSSRAAEDVRELTGPLWALAENGASGDSYGRLPLARFVWGKFWNVPGVIGAIAERLEFFTTGGAPRRSFLRMRFLRVTEPGFEPEPAPAPAAAILDSPETETGDVAPQDLRAHETLGAGMDEESGASAERVDELAARYYGDPAMWRTIAALNGIDDPLRVPAGQILRVPPLASVRRKT